MNQGLLVILSIIGLLALYWALIGQWRWNKTIRESEQTEKIEKNEPKKNKKQNKTYNL